MVCVGGLILSLGSKWKRDEISMGRCLQKKVGAARKDALSRPSLFPRMALFFFLMGTLLGSLKDRPGLMLGSSPHLSSPAGHGAIGSRVGIAELPTSAWRWWHHMSHVHGGPAGHIGITMGGRLWLVMAPDSPGW